MEVAGDLDQILGKRELTGEVSADMTRKLLRHEEGNFAELLPAEFFEARVAPAPSMVIPEPVPPQEEKYTIEELFDNQDQYQSDPESTGIPDPTPVGSPTEEFIPDEEFKASLRDQSAQLTDLLTNLQMQDVTDEQAASILGRSGNQILFNPGDPWYAGPVNEVVAAKLFRWESGMPFKRLRFVRGDAWYGGEGD